MSRAGLAGGAAGARSLLHPGSLRSRCGAAAQRRHQARVPTQPPGACSALAITDPLKESEAHVYFINVYTQLLDPPAQTFSKHEPQWP